jgi:adenylate kinase family enzyme
MPLFLISGSSGTGKSLICRALKEKRFEAYDTDDDGLARWQHNATRYIHPKSSVKSEMRTADFIEQHSWIVPREYIEDLAQKAADHTIFVCGSLGNEEELHDLFKAVFALYVDDDTLTERLTNRTTNNWGKQPHELEQTLRHHHAIYDKYRERGDFIIDATQKPDKIVKEILSSSDIQ